MLQPVTTANEYPVTLNPNVNQSSSLTQRSKAPVIGELPHRKTPVAPRLRRCRQPYRGCEEQTPGYLAARNCRLVRSLCPRGRHQSQATEARCVLVASKGSEKGVKRVFKICHTAAGHLDSRIKLARRIRLASFHC